MLSGRLGANRGYFQMTDEPMVARVERPVAALAISNSRLRIEVMCHALKT